MGTLCVRSTKLVWMLWSVHSVSTPIMSSLLPLRLWWGNPSGYHGPTSTYIWQDVTMCCHAKTCLLSLYIKKHKKINNSKKFKNKRVGIRYQCHRMLTLVVEAYQDLPENLSLHRGNHWWKLSATATMERSQLDRGWTPYLHPICASHLPNIIGPDLKPREEERQL